jgi:hypothetical protein
VERVAYFGQNNCRHFSNGTVELIVTTDIGPRIIRYAFVGGENILGEVPQLEFKTEWGLWKPWGGHRLCPAPEELPRTYSIDKQPNEFDIQNDLAICLRQPAGPETANIEKEITVTLDPRGTGVTIHHKITNRSAGAIEVAPWALTILNGGGATILPQEPFRSHDDCLTPARPLVLWYFTDLTDPRLILGRRYISLCNDPARSEPLKIGIGNKRGWAAYSRGSVLFVKRFDYQQDAAYPDYGSNNEVYTAGSFMELESLAPLRRLELNTTAEHRERWGLLRTAPINISNEQEIDQIMQAIDASLP